jgi:hypothetical protein
MNIRRSLGLLGASAAITASLVLAPSAAGAETTTTNELRPRIERACARIPNLQLRTDNLLTRLGSDATTIGSLAWLDQQIAQAQAAGRTQLVTVLQNRRNVRAASVDVLQKRKTELETLTTLCAKLQARS